MRNWLNVNGVVRTTWFAHKAHSKNTSGRLRMQRLIGAGLVSIIISCVGICAAHQATVPSSFDERLGEDDGAALVILFGANLRGNLDTCDCAHPRGGLARRVGYVEGFKKKFKDTPVIQVEGGNFLLDAVAFNGEVPENVLLQNELIIGAYSRWPVDVINLARADLLYAQRLLDREGFAERVDRFPAIKKFISANAKFDADVIAPPSYIVKGITGPRIPMRRGRCKIGFVGLAEPERVAEGVDSWVSNMFQAARRVIPHARKQCDILVVLVHAEMDAALQIAKDNPEADVVVATNAAGIYKPKHVGNVLVVHAGTGNTQQGELRVYLAKGNRPNYKFRLIDLDEAIPSDPAVAAYTVMVRAELEKSRSQRPRQ
jgi:2',3'-cyclic-nucleotide 2'-phosphodiesterase (5'-nucleotidase family)